MAGPGHLPSGAPLEGGRLKVFEEDKIFKGVKSFRLLRAEDRPIRKENGLITSETEEVQQVQTMRYTSRKVAQQCVSLVLFIVFSKF